MEVPLNQTAKCCYSIFTYLYLDEVILEMVSQFSGNDQDIICAQGNIILVQSRWTLFVSYHYDVGLDPLKAEMAIYTKFVNDPKQHSGSQLTAADVIKPFYKNDLLNLLPVLNKIVAIFTSISVTSYSVEYLFRGIKQMKTYWRIITVAQT